MLASWWDDLHGALWRTADRADLLAVQRAARQVARCRAPCGILPPFADGAPIRPVCLAALDANGLTGDSLRRDPRPGDASGAGALGVGLGRCWSSDLSMSGFLAQMPIRDFGTASKEALSGHTTGFRHGALCLTEPIPGAQARTPSSLRQRRVAGQSADGRADAMKSQSADASRATWIRGFRAGRGVGRWRQCAWQLPGDSGAGRRRALRARRCGTQAGPPIRFDDEPTFDLRVPARRIVGGFSQSKRGRLVPCFDHRQLLEPALRRTRALLSLMTASKALTTVREAALEARGAASVGIFQSLADLWAAGEAARALGFSAAQLCDALDRTTDPGVEDSRLAALYSPAAKLFSSSALPPLLVQLAGWSVSGSEFSLRLQARLVDAQIEEMHMGPSAVQRRLVSAIVTGGWFLALFRRWCEELETFSSRLPVEGTRSLTAAMRLWIWTLDWLRQMHDCHGAHLLCDARQSVGFALTDSFCALLAARSLALELLQAQADPAWNDASTSVFRDIFTLAAGRAAARVPNVCAEQILGWGPRFVLPAEQAAKFRCLCAQLYVSLDGVLEAQDRIVSFLASAPMENL